MYLQYQHEKQTGIKRLIWFLARKRISKIPKISDYLFILKQDCVSKKTQLLWKQSLDSQICLRFLSHLMMRRYMVGQSALHQQYPPTKCHCWLPFLPEWAKGSSIPISYNDGTKAIQRRSGLTESVLSHSNQFRFQSVAMTKATTVQLSVKIRVFKLFIQVD